MSKLDSIKRFFIAICTVILAGGSLGVLGTLVSPSVASAATPITLYASPNGTGTCASGSSPCSLATAISTAGGSTYSGDAVTIALEHSSGSQCSTGSVCTFDGDFVASTWSEASLTIAGTGDSSAASVLNGGGAGTTFSNDTSNALAVTLDDVTVTGGGYNSYSDIGGGISNLGTATIVDSTIEGNMGGGIFAGGNTTIVDSTISGNSAAYGGGISTFGNTTIVDSTISGNSAAYGGGIYNETGNSFISVNTTIVDSTISGNTATFGSGIYNPYSEYASVTIAGSIVADHIDSGNCHGIIIDAGYNLSNGTSCGFGSTTTTSASSVPDIDLGTLANNVGMSRYTKTIAISGLSPAAAFITSNGGLVNLCSDASYTTFSGYVANLSVDQRGVSRPADGCSAGAYEQPVFGDVYTPINPQILADTRCISLSRPVYITSSYCAYLPPANSELTTLVTGHSAENVTVTGVDGVPLTATAVAINVTAVNMTSNGYLDIYPQGFLPSSVHSLSWTAGSGVVTNLVTVPVNTSNGEITITNGGGGSVDYVVDIEGYYAPAGNTSAGLYNPVAPSRLVDTRCSETSPPGYITSSYCASLPSTNSNLTTLGTGQIENVTVTGVAGIPSSGVSAVVLNLTAIEPTHSGYLTIFPTGATKAVVSAVDFNAGETIANSVMAKVGSNGQISVYNFLGNVNFALDVSGYYTNGSSSSQTGLLFNSVTPENLPNVNATLTVVLSSDPVVVQVAGEANVPTDATAVVGNLTATDSTGSGYLTAYAGGTAPSTSDVDFSAGSTNANMVVSGLTSSGGLNIINGGGHKVNVLFDVSGYFAPATA